MKTKRGRRRLPKTPLPHAHDPESLASWFLRFLEHLRLRNYSENTVLGRERYGQHFVRWCDERAIVYPQSVTKAVVETYQRFLFYYRMKSGEPLRFPTQYSHLMTVQQLFRYLTRQNVVPSNPASEIELPKLGTPLPRAVLNVEEVERVLNTPDTRTVLGLRDRAMLEVFYSTGIRRAELKRLSVYDVDAARSVVFVREGKGKKDRVVPIGERALLWVHKYLIEARPELVVAIDDHVLFLTQDGDPFTLDALTSLVGQHVRVSGVSKKGSCHMFRHTMATLMLEGGADIRYVQAMLGHASLETTAIYTRVSVHKLAQIHAATHPGAMLRPLAKTNGLKHR